MGSAHATITKVLYRKPEEPKDRAMAENFDPYYKWLGIPPKYQPPDHYRLLGIEIFESDPEVIEVSADKQVDYLKRCATGPNVEFSQKLLNEISAARLCLLNPAKKAAYDATLKKANPAAAASAVDPQQESSSIDSGLQTSGPTQQSTTAAGFDWNSDPSRLPERFGRAMGFGHARLLAAATARRQLASLSRVYAVWLWRLPFTLGCKRNPKTRNRGTRPTSVVRAPAIRSMHRSQTARTPVRLAWPRQSWRRRSKRILIRSRPKR